MLSYINISNIVIFYAVGKNIMKVPILLDSAALAH